MFDIDDNFLASVGYNVATLSDTQKTQYKTEIEKEINTRLSERIAREISDEEADDLETIQNSEERAMQWLYEFHGEFISTDEYKALVEALGDADAKIFSATALWLRHAVPHYGMIAKEMLTAYQVELIEKRAMVQEALGA